MSMDMSFFLVHIGLTLIITQYNCVSKFNPHRSMVDLEEKVLRNPIDFMSRLRSRFRIERQLGGRHLRIELYFFQLGQRVFGIPNVSHFYE